MFKYSIKEYVIISLILIFILPIALTIKQECEVLKFKIHDLRQLRELDREARVRFYNQACEYRKALEEIKAIVNEPCVAESLTDCEHCEGSCEHKDILNIINKVYSYRMSL